jgi:alpha-glucoside transport system substrate-binding protein
MLKDTPQAEALIKYLAGPTGASIWATAGGFTSPNKTVPTSAYPDPVTQKDAQALVNATSFVFSLDDLQGTWEPMMWTDMRNFLKPPSNVSAIQATMEAQATAGLGH